MKKRILSGSAYIIFGYLLLFLSTRQNSYFWKFLPALFGFWCIILGIYILFHKNSDGR